MKFFSLVMTTSALLAMLTGCGAIRHEDNQSHICPDLDKYEAEFKELCAEYIEGHEAVNTTIGAMCASLRDDIDQLRDNCYPVDRGGQTEVVFAPSRPPSAGVNINLSGAKTRDIKLIIHSPKATN